MGRCCFIDPTALSISPLEIDLKNESRVRDTLKCQHVDTAYCLINGDIVSIFIDAEAQRMPGQSFFGIAGRNRPLAGKGLLCVPAEPEECICHAGLSITEAERSIAFLISPVETRDGAPPALLIPAGMIRNIGPLKPFVDVYGGMIDNTYFLEEFEVSRLLLP